MIRDGVLNPFLIRRTVTDPDTGEECYRCTKGPDGSQFHVTLDEYRRECFTPPTTPSHLNAWAVTKQDVDMMCERYPSIGWKDSKRVNASIAEVAKLEKELLLSQDKVATLTEQLEETFKNQTLTIRCNGDRAGWGASLAYLVKELCDLFEKPKASLTREAYFEHLHKNAPDQLLREAFDIVWRLIPSRYKSGHGRPKKNTQ